jgi:cysteine-rich repeat protein
MQRICAVAAIVSLAAGGVGGRGQLPEPPLSHVAPRLGSPPAIRMSRLTIRTDEFFARYASQYRLGAEDRMQPYAVGRGAGGFSYTKFRQYHRGVRVIGGEVVLTHRDGLVAFALGEVAPDLSLDVGPTLSAEAAVDSASAAVRQSMRLPSGDPLPFRRPPHVELAIGRQPSSRVTPYRLLYRCTIDTVARGRYVVDVDARTGASLNVTPQTRGAWTLVDASGQSLYNGLVQFRAQLDDATGNCRLQTPFVSTFNTQAPPNVSMPFNGSGVDYVSPGCAFSEEAVAPGVSAHWAVEQARLYFLKRFNREGWDNQGGASAIYVDVPRGTCDGAPSCWDPNFDAILAVTPLVGRPPAVALDIMGHEYTHGVAQSAVPPDGLEAKGESGALEESFSDIFGTAVEFAVPGTNPNWTVGEDLSGFYVPRDLQDPKQKRQPKAYGGQFWLDPNQDDTSHANGGVQNFWFYLLANNVGQSTVGTVDDCDANIASCESYDVKGIGIDAAARIAYDNLTTKLTSSASYWHAREGAIESAIQLCGEGSQMQLSTENAWHAVKLGGVAEPLAFSPTPGADTAVEPWPAMLKWKAGIGDAKWDIQISTTADFSTNLQSDSTTSTVTESGTLYGSYKVALAPSVKYYWRVRRSPDPASPDPGSLPAATLDLCWRPVASFTTSDKQSTAMSPNRKTYYPWQLAFDWTDTPGAIGYRVEVFEVSDCDHADPIFTRNTKESPTSDHFSVKVNQDHWWRVRPIGDHNPPVHGPWSECVPFKTTMPAVTLVKPAHNQSVYPWGLELQWNPVKGAARYRLYMTRGREGFTSDAHVEEIPLDKPLQTTKMIDLVPEMTYLDVRHWWRVTVEGPRLFSQQGTPAEDHFANNGSATTPATQDFLDCFCAGCSSECPIPHRAYGQDVTVGWTHVDLAEKYKITFFPFKAPANGGDFWVDFDHPAHTATVDRVDTPNDDHQSQTFEGSVVAAPASGTQTYGYWYSVQSIGPHGLESPVAHQTTPNDPLAGGGMKGESLYYLISPSVVASTGLMLQDGTGKYYAEGNPENPFVTMAVSQTPQWSPTGQWEYRIYDEPGCSDFVVDLLGSDTHSVGWGPGDEGAFRVRTHGVYGAFQLQGPGWSPCTNVHMAGLDKQKKLECGNASVGAWEECDDGNTASGDGCSSSCQLEGPPPSPCDLLVQAGSIEGSPPGGFQVDLGSGTGDFWFVWDTVNIPDRLQLFQGSTQLADTGCVGTQDPACSGAGCGGAQLIPWDGSGSSIVRVNVGPNCAMKSGITQWAFVVTCPQAPPKPQATPSPEQQ